MSYSVSQPRFNSFVSSLLPAFIQAACMEVCGVAQAPPRTLNISGKFSFVIRC